MSTTIAITCSACHHSWHAPISNDIAHCPECCEPVSTRPPNFSPELVDTVRAVAEAAEDSFRCGEQAGYARGYRDGHRDAIAEARRIFAEAIASAVTVSVSPKMADVLQSARAAELTPLGGGPLAPEPAEGSRQ